MNTGTQYLKEQARNKKYRSSILGKETQKKYYLKNKNKIKASSRARHERLKNNLEYLFNRRAYGKRYRKNNTEKLITYRNRPEVKTRHLYAAMKYSAKRRYGLTDKEYLRRKYQNLLCPICNKRPPRVLDHNHETGIPREFLCDRCNCLLAGIEDKEYLLNAQQYLQDWEAIDLAQRAYA